MELLHRCFLNSEIYILDHKSLVVQYSWKQGIMPVNRGIFLRQTLETFPMMFPIKSSEMTCFFENTIIYAGMPFQEHPAPHS
jgi:hypothetical protein